MNPDAKNRNNRATKHFGLYDRFIVVLRWGLSAIALGLAITLLIWPNIQTSEVSFTLSQEDVASGDGTVRMINPRYVGTDDKNRPFVIEASSGIQDSPDDPRVRLNDISAIMDIDDETGLRIFSATGIYLIDQEVLELGGGVEMATTDGYQFRAVDARYNMVEKRAMSKSSITGSGPVGVFEADSFEILVDQRLAIFEGHVRMVINPRLSDIENEK